MPFSEATKHEAKERAGISNGVWRISNNGTRIAILDGVAGEEVNAIAQKDTTTPECD
jgi:hypothetical protein